MATTCPSGRCQAPAPDSERSAVRGIIIRDRCRVGLSIRGAWADVRPLALGALSRRLRSDGPHAWIGRDPAVSSPGWLTLASGAKQASRASIQCGPEERGRGSCELPARIWALGLGCDLGNGATSRGHAPKLESKAMNLGRGASPIKNRARSCTRLDCLRLTRPESSTGRTTPRTWRARQARLDECLTLRDRICGRRW